jgi:DNA-binding NarL/FixJ family response regulator
MKILIADDHELFRDGLRHVLAQLGEPLTLVEACDFEQAVAAIHDNCDIDLVLLDLGMPGADWTDGLRRVRESLPDRPVIILSAIDDRRHVLQAVNLGAAGFIPKSSPSRVMLSALRLVLSGGVYLPPALIEPQGGILPDGFNPEQAIAFLTPRQREVLALLGQGKSNKEIARSLELAEGTVKLHVTAILKALGVNNRTRAVVAASHLGLRESES